MSAPITMQSHAENYLCERRRLGFGLRSPGYSINSFACYVDALDHRGPLTIEVMADWARHDKGNSNKPATWNRTVEEPSPFCPLSAAVRPTHRGAGRHHLRPDRSATGPAYLQRAGNHRFAGCGTPSRSTTGLARGNLRDIVRLDRINRPARLGSSTSPRRGCRPEVGHADHHGRPSSPNRVRFQCIRAQWGR